MYKPKGERKNFDNPTDGLKAGYFVTYNEMAQAYANGVIDDNGERVVIDEVEDDSIDIDTLTVDELRNMAPDLGIDPTQHHATLRKQIRELVHAQVRAD
jgi:hypothetical protein